MVRTTDKKLGQLRLDLEHVLAGIQTHAAELGDMSAEIAAIQTMLADLQSLNDAQEQLKAGMTAATARLEEKSGQGQELLSRLRSLIKGKLGPKNQKLAAFGITVRK